MKYTEITFETPEENLACDEALLDLCEDGYGEEIIRFWEPNRCFVVLGYSGKVSQEVNLRACQKNKIPILRRPSGGGTVLQGPGCFNFSLILDTQNGRPIRNLVETNKYVMGKHKQALEPLLEFPISIEGFTDLTINRLKFSGNAQRRKKRFLLFHGSFLLKFNLAMIEKYLLIPKRQPAYRKNRNHLNFLMNLNVPAKKIKSALKQIWSADEPAKILPKDLINQLVKERYSNRDWTFKF